MWMHVWTYLIDDKALPHSPRALDWLLLMVRLWTCLCRGAASGPIPLASSQNLPPLPVSGAAAAVSLATGVCGERMCCFRVVLLLDALLPPSVTFCAAGRAWWGCASLAGFAWVPSLGGSAPAPPAGSAVQQYWFIRGSGPWLLSSPTSVL